MLNILEPRLITLRESGFIPRTILDLGAHRGDWSVLVHSIFPSADIFMVEANVDHANELKEHDWAKGYETALLGDKEKRSVPYYASTSPYNTGNSIFKEQTQFFDNCQVRNIPMITLDELVAKHKLKNIDFIKIDTQGSEMNILKGASKTLKNVEFILLETQNLEYNLGAPDTTDIMVFMKSLGYTLFDITELHHLPTGEMLGVDMIFAKNNSKFIRKQPFI